MSFNLYKFSYLDFLSWNLPHRFTFLRDFSTLFFVTIWLKHTEYCYRLQIPSFSMCICLLISGYTYCINNVLCDFIDEDSLKKLGCMRHLRNMQTDAEI